MNSSVEQSPESIVGSSSLLSEVVPYGDGVVTISAITDRLRLDFLEEARTRPNSDMNLAEQIAWELKFFTDRRGYNAHVVSDLRRKGLVAS